MNFENICTEKEAQFLLNNLKPTDNVLEYGNGDLAMQIANKVRHVSVITHDLNSYGKVIENKPDNIEVLHVPTNIPQTSDDGNYNEFKDYIEAPKELLNRFGKFNVIIIRGRARVECAKFAKNIAQEGCKIFVLDYAHPNPEYTRNEYFEIEKHLIKTGAEFTMHLFSIENETNSPLEATGKEKLETTTIFKVVFDENTKMSINETPIKTSEPNSPLDVESKKSPTGCGQKSWWRKIKAAFKK